MTEPKLCSDCGRPKFRPGTDSLTARDLCENADGGGPLTQQIKCTRLTIASLRSALAASQADVDRLKANLSAASDANAVAFIVGDGSDWGPGMTTVQLDSKAPSAASTLALVDGANLVFEVLPELLRQSGRESFSLELLLEWLPMWRERFSAEEIRTRPAPDSTSAELAAAEQEVIRRAVDWRGVQGPTPCEFECEEHLLSAVDALLVSRAALGLGEQKGDGNGER